MWLYLYCVDMSFIAMHCIYTFRLVIGVDSLIIFRPVGEIYLSGEDNQVACQHMDLILTT